MYADELQQEIFEPAQNWNKWQETKNYKIEVSFRTIFPNLEQFVRLESQKEVS